MYFYSQVDSIVNIIIIFISDNGVHFLFCLFRYFNFNIIIYRYYTYCDHITLFGLDLAKTQLQTIARPGVARLRGPEQKITRLRNKWLIKWFNAKQANTGR